MTDTGSKPITLLGMTGWHISVYRLGQSATLDGVSNVQELRAKFPTAWKGDAYEDHKVGQSLCQGERIAVWQAELGGIDWLMDLFNAERALGLGNGYPFYFFAFARDLTPTILKGPPYAKETWSFSPGDVIGPGWDGHTAIDTEVIAKCSPSEWLTVEAFDES